MLSLPRVFLSVITAVSVATLLPAQQMVAVGSQPGAQALERPVNIRLSGVSVKQALRTIADSAHVRLVFRHDLLDAERGVVSYQGLDVTAAAAFARVLEGTRLRIVALGADVVGIEERDAALAMPQGVVTGMVRHAKTKQPLAGVTVASGEQKAVTDAGGRFRLVLAPGSHVVTVRGIGFTHQTRTISVTSGEQSLLDIALEPSASVLDEVIVTGTVVATERRAIPNPITVITAEDIEKRGITRLEEFFRGEVPGVIALEQGSVVYQDGLGDMAKSQVYVRGASGLGGTGRDPGQANPLKTYIDGVEVLDPLALGTIDPQSIERIEIITGPQAATIYGSGAMGGVMQIFTKQGRGDTQMEITGRVQYGTLESNLSNGRTPVHRDALTVTGGAGTIFSYTGTLSHNYSGQWQPNLFSRSVGASLGIRHERGPLAFRGSVAVTTNRNGTTTGEFGQRPLVMAKGLSGEWRRYQAPVHTSRRIASSEGQTFTLNLDYRPGRLWMHTVTIGRNQTNFGVTPDAPNYKTPVDSLYIHALSTGARMTYGYNATFVPARLGVVSSNLTIGVNGSSGSQLQVTGRTADLTSSSYVTTPAPSVTRPYRNTGWGGFSRWQLGAFDRLFLTLGLRAERNAAYGQDHKIDWTPTNGLTYSQEIGNLTIKALGSYGKATRPPTEQMRLATFITSTNIVELQTYPGYLAAPGLTPEYSRGPQGGIELYYGNLGSLTINRYKQNITDGIRAVMVDSLDITYISCNCASKIYTWQYQNIIDISNHGWEFTGNVNAGPLALKGTYSWTDSRVTNYKYGSDAFSFYPGMTLPGMPSHTGNISVQYASGNTSISLTSNYVGKVAKYVTDNPYSMEQSYSRISTYVERGRSDFPRYQTSAGYVKSNLAVQHRMNSWATATVNVTNLGNSFGSEGSLFDPALGRQTVAGVSVRLPKR